MDIEEVRCGNEGKCTGGYLLTKEGGVFTIKYWATVGERRVLPWY